MSNSFRPKKKAEVKKEPQKRDGKLLTNDNRVKFLLGVFLIFFTFFLGISFFSYLFTGSSDQDVVQRTVQNISGKTSTDNILGLIGAKISHWFIFVWFGISSFLILIPLFFAGFRLVFNEDLFKLDLYRWFIGSVFYMFFIALFLGYFVHVFSIPTTLLSGRVGLHANELLHTFMGYGSLFLTVLLLVSWLVFFHGFTSIDDFLWSTYFPKKVGRTFVDEEEEVGPEVHSAAEEEAEEEIVSPEPLRVYEEEEIVPKSPVKEPFKGPDVAFTVEAPQAIAEDFFEPEEKSEELVSEYGEYDPKLDLSSYQYPPLSLLAEYSNMGSQVTQEELEANKNRIVETINNFGIGISSIKANIGPTVTLYEIVPDAGVRISKIKNLEDDIALSLSALGIRIIAPMPGKGTIGIEVPNKKREMVSMKSVMASEKFQKAGFELPVILGKTISNEIFVADLAKMPHLLMAGATGQGKSVGLNVILTSLLYKKHPAEVKFVLVDPKKVELTLFNKIERHFLAMLPNAEEAIITDTKKVINTLNSLCIEMDQRYNLLKDASVRNIKEYNVKFVKRKLNPEKGHKYLPYIVLVIDELADLMMTAGKEVEQPIARLAQLARAIGIHLIVATQRPSVNVITGLIKANFPARLSFKVTAKVDSRTIMDTGGAEQLVGNGDMLLSTGSEMIRLQCPFVDTPEVESICEYIGEQRAYTSAYLLPEYYGDDEPDVADFDPTQLDPLFEEAARLLVLHQQGSTSLIQRKMKLGYNRAGRIVDQLEGAGILGPFEGSKAREVLVKDMEHLEEMLRNLRR
jgi:S-DNA-T family DNA segregation ATPase FtsK/SpoIIIE